MSDVNKLESEINTEKPTGGRSWEFFRRMNMLIKDQKVKEGAKAGVRTLLNIGISFADLVPGGAGEILDVAATVGKYVKSGKISFDLTPDVNPAINWAANIPEFFTAGGFPSYAVPTGIQLIKDVPRMYEGTVQAVSIIRGEVEDYQKNKPAIDAAISTFN